MQISDIIRNLIDANMSVRLCVWNKSNPSPMNGDRLWLSSAEFCVFGKKPNATFNQHCKSSVWNYPTELSKIHPTQKPVRLIEYLISSSSNSGDTVFDPCFGSGTTAIASMLLRRKFIGCELDPQFFSDAKERIENQIVTRPLF